MCRLRNIAMRDYQESVTTGQTDRQTPDKVIPLCRYALQQTQKSAIRRNTDLTYIIGLIFQTVSRNICTGMTGHSE